MTPVSRRVPFQWNGGEIWPRINPNALFDTLGIADSLGSTNEVLVPLVDTIGFSDAVGVAWEISVAVDTLAISDAAGAILTLHAAAADTLSVSDSIGSLQLAAAADTLAIADALSSTVYSPVAAADTLAFADAATTILFVSAYDTLSLADSASAVLTLYASAADTLSISDSASDGATNPQHVMVMNLDTGAVSEYVLPVVVTGMAQRNGVLYLATTAGLFALDAATDDGDDIVWRWRTGLAHLGTDLLKRVIDVNALGRTEGAVIAEVVTTRDGTKRADRFQLPAATRDSHRDAVIKVGKGLTSVYWAFGERGTAPAERHEIRVSATPLSRRR